MSAGRRISGCVWKLGMDVHTTAVSGHREFRARAPGILLSGGDFRLISISILVALAYYVAAKIGFALTFKPRPVSVMWLPNSILVAGLLLSPIRTWWLLLLSALPAHLAAELGSGVPWSMVLCWFISNSFEAILAATAILIFTKKPVSFHTFQNIGVFFLCGALLAPLLSSFLDSGFVMLNHWGSQGYWQVWKERLFSNVCASIVMVPMVVAWCSGEPLRLRKVSLARMGEALFLACGFLITCIAVFSSNEASTAFVPALLYAPLPFLLWATVRFRFRGITTAIFILAILATWGATHGRGPFPTTSPALNAVSVQAFLVGIGITLNLFATSLVERETAVAASKASEERYREVVESQTELVCRSLPDTTLTFVNNAYCQVFGRSRAELIGRKFLELLPPSAHEEVLLQIANLVTNERAISTEHQVFLPGGGIGSQQWTAYPIKDSSGNVREIQAIGRDISRQKSMELALRESEERNRAILDAFPDLMFLFNKSGVYIDYYASDEHQLAVPPEKFLNRGVQDILPEKLAQEVLISLESVARTGQMKILEYELEISGQTRCYEARLVRCGSDRILSLIREITERKHAQEALKLSQERYREVVESQTDLVARFLPDTTITFVNKACCGFFEKRAEELIGRKLLEMLPSELHPKILSNIAAVAEEKGPVACEHSLRRADGTLAWYQWMDYGIKGPDGKLKEIQGIGRDVTDRKRAEEAGEKLVHASRLAVVGELTAMIAHEVNQPLSAILNNAEVAESLFGLANVPPDEIRAVLADIRDDGIRACKVIRRIRDLVQKRTKQVQSFEMNGLIKDVVRIVSADALRRHIQIRMEFSSDLPRIDGDPVRLQQVLLNLILNGMDAMSDVPEWKRVLTLQTQQGENGSLVVTVADSGHGISADVLPRIFESFFSTKADGMGLGLSVARSIIEDHQGRIWAESNEGTGTAIHFALPLGGWDEKLPDCAVSSPLPSPKRNIDQPF